MNLSRLLRVLTALFFLVPTAGSLRAYQLTGQSWPFATTISMQLELGPTSVNLIDGLGTWNNSAADALAIWNQSLDGVKFNWVLDSTAPKDSLDGYNSVFFDNTILGEGFGENTLAATVVWYNTSDYGTAIETDVVFNTAQSFNSYRGPLLANSYDFHRVALHEFGHVLGLAHVGNFPYGQALMEATISNLDQVAPDDIAGVVSLYGYRITSMPQFDGFVVGEEASFTVTANNAPTSFTAVGLPSGLTLDLITGQVTGTPLEAGTFQVTITAHGSPRDVSAIIAVVVNVASITSSTLSQFVEIGTPVTYTITADNNPTSFTATSLPPGLVLNSATGVISGVPTLDGYFAVPVVAKGAQYDASGTIGFAVTPAYRQTIAELSPTGQIIRTAQDPLRNRLYVMTNRNVVVVDTDLVSIIATIPVTFVGVDLSISPDNSRLWVIDGAGIRSYSLTDFSLLPEIPGAPFHFEQVREGLGGKLYVTNPPSIPGSDLTNGLYQLDLATGAITPIRVAMPGYSIDPRIDTSPDGKNLYATFVEGLPVMTRYDIAGGAPVVLTNFTPPTASYFTEMSVSPDGKLVGYKFQDQYVAGETIFTIAHTLKGPATIVNPTVEPGSMNFSAGGAYVHRTVNTGYQHYQLDFINTANGYPYNSWTVLDYGPAFADHKGTNLYLMGYSTIYVYSLASDGLPGPEPTPKSLLNVSTRSVVGADDSRMIGGFIITGDASKEIAFRALGPTLPVVGAMTDPTISVYDSTGALVATNQNWNQYRDQIVSAGLAPFNDHEAALITTLEPGSYTAVVNFETGSTGGVGLVELYDLSSDNSGKIANLSTRSKVGTGDNVLIGGFIVGGTEPTEVIARAIGPTLAGSVTGVLLDPILELRGANGTELASNDDWRSEQESEISASGLAPADDRESAILTSLQPGPYTVILRGKDSTTGIGLVEIYNLDSTAPAQNAPSR